MKSSDLILLADGMGPVIRELVETSVAKLAARLELVEAHLADVEAKSLRYVGIFQRAASYRRHDAVSHNGALWNCTADRTEAAPGTSSDWQMMTKAGTR